MFVPPKSPTHLTTQAENVAYINARSHAKHSADPHAVAWHIGLSGNGLAKEQFANAQRRVDAFVAQGWSVIGIEDEPRQDTANKSIAIIVDGLRRYYVLQAPSCH